MAKSSSALSGVSNTIANLKEMKSDLGTAAMSALHSEAEDILTTAQDNTTPVDTGALRDSGVVVDDPNDDNSLTVGIGFGSGKSEPYALAVHETPSPHDPPSWVGKDVHFRVGGSKYLERPLLAAVSGMASRISSNISENLKD